MSRELNEADREVIAAYVEEMSLSCEQPRPFCLAWKAQYVEPKPNIQDRIIKLEVFSILPLAGPSNQQHLMWNLITLLMSFDKGTVFGGYYRPLTSGGGSVVMLGGIDGRNLDIVFSSQNVQSIDYDREKITEIEGVSLEGLEKSFFV